MRVAKWGNSLAVLLPKRLVDDLGLEAGDELEVVAACRSSPTVARDERQARAPVRIQDRQWRLPAGYRFDRAEAHER